MKANLPIEYDRLKPSDRKRLLDAMERAHAKDMNVMLDLFLKMSCIALYDSKGMTEEELFCYLGTYRQFFRRQAILVKEGRQIEEIDRRLAEIFPENGYPNEIFRGMIADWQA